MRHKEVTNLALHMVDCLTSLRTERNLSFENLDRLPKSIVLKADSIDDHRGHRFSWNDNCWICLNYCYRTLDPSRAPSSAPCKGTFLLFVDLFCDPKGHSLWISEFGKQEVLIHCTRCWGYASSVSRNLSRECCGMTGKVYPCARSFLRRALHPISRLRLYKPAKLHG